MKQAADRAGTVAVLGAEQGLEPVAGGAFEKEQAQGRSVRPALAEEGAEQRGQRAGQGLGVIHHQQSGHVPGPIRRCGGIGATQGGVGPELVTPFRGEEAGAPVLPLRLHAPQELHRQPGLAGTRLAHQQARGNGFAGREPAPKPGQVGVAPDEAGGAMSGLEQVQLPGGRIGLGQGPEQAFEGAGRQT